MQLNLIRRVRGRFGLLLCILTGAVWIASAQPVKEEISDVAALRAEVQRLALQLLQYRAELIQWKMHSFSAELEHVRAERQRLNSERQLIEREIGELNQTSANGAGAEDEERRQELNNVQLPALLASEGAVNAREAMLSSALSTESAQMTDVQEQAERLATQARGQK
jgi:hypothetical protein